MLVARQRKEPAVTHTRTPGTYTVRMDPGLSDKRFRDAVQLVKGINGIWDEWAYDPQHPGANATTGYVRNDCADPASSSYDADTKTWTVVIPRNARSASVDLAALIDSYHATVELMPAPAPAVTDDPDSSAVITDVTDPAQHDALMNRLNAGNRAVIRRTITYEYAIPGGAYEGYTLPELIEEEKRMSHSAWLRQTDWASASDDDFDIVWTAPGEAPVSPGRQDAAAEQADADAAADLIATARQNYDLAADLADQAAADLQDAATGYAEAQAAADEARAALRVALAAAPVPLNVAAAADREARRD
jgi:hypothetical protein